MFKIYNKTPVTLKYQDGSTWKIKAFIKSSKPCITIYELAKMRQKLNSNKRIFLKRTPKQVD